MAVSIWSDNNINKKGIVMAKYKLQELTDMRNEGKRRVYPKMVTNRTLSRKEFVKKMQGYHRGISESTTEAVLMDVADMLVEMLSMGYNVNLEGIGTFSLSLGFEDDKPTEMQGEDDKMAYRKVGVKDINFKASPELLKSVKQETDRDLERDMGGVKVIRKQLYSREERIAHALEVIEANGFITLSDYAYINNLSRTAASLELKEITADRTSPIDSMGSGSHKVWVKRKE
jgi:predicted histone-like DNA-binding protein